MIKILRVCCLAMFLGSCVTNPVPQGYRGPISYINDGMTAHSSQKADFFVVEKINGRRIDDSIVHTIHVNKGRGLSMTPEVIGREVPSGKAKYSLLGRTHYAAPILALTNTVHEVAGEVDLELLPDVTYSVKGFLSAEYSSIWVEDTRTGEVVGAKVESRRKIK